MHQSVKIGVAVLVVAALSMSGLALAETGSPTDAAPDEVPVTELPGFAVIVSQLAPLVADGVITDAQAEAVAEQLVQVRRDRVRAQRRDFAFLANTAALLGLTPHALRHELATGATLAVIAEANGSSGDELVDGLLEVIEEHLAGAVASGRLSEEEMAVRLEAAEERLQALVTSPFPHRTDRAPPPGGSPTVGAAT